MALACLRSSPIDRRAARRDVEFAIERQTQVGGREPVDAQNVGPHDRPASCRKTAPARCPPLPAPSLPDSGPLMASNCACAASSQRTIRITLTKSRRRIASPKAWDYVDLAFSAAITAGIRERQNGFGGLFAAAATPSRQVTLRVIEPTRRLTGSAAEVSPQSRHEGGPTSGHLRVTDLPVGS